MARRRSRVAKLIDKQRVRNRRGRSIFRGRAKSFALLTAKVFFVLVLLSALTFGAYTLYRFAFLSNYFELKTLVITGVSDEMAEELRVLTQLEANQGINLLKVNPRRVRETLLKHPKIKSARVTKRYPNALLIEVQERIPVAVVSSGALYLVDRDGYVLEDVANLNREQSRLPFITGIDAKSIALGEPIPTKAISQALDLFECLRRRNKQLASILSEIRADPEEGLTLVLAGGVEVRLGTDHFPERLAALELMIRKRGSLKDLKYIDLRFRNQIVYRLRRD